VRYDTCFSDVIHRCAAAPRAGQDGTWITDDMVAAYVRLFDLGFAHSVESWQDGALVGGVYGGSLGAAFFGESMFAEKSDASKVAFATLVRQLEAWGYHFLDCQVRTDHTAALGATEWPRARFLASLAAALEHPTRRGRWTLV
jgi:leucyl/phenylalanyl-tRNA--protein transferase